jgi:hypothetical protein
MFTTSHVVRNEATHELFLGATVVLRSRDQAQAFRRFLSRYSLESNPGRAIYGLEFRDFIEDNVKNDHEEVFSGSEINAYMDILLGCPNIRYLQIGFRLYELTLIGEQRLKTVDEIVAEYHFELIIACKTLGEVRFDMMERWNDPTGPEMQRTMQNLSLWAEQSFANNEQSVKVVLGKMIRCSWGFGAEHLLRSWKHILTYIHRR